MKAKNIVGKIYVSPMPIVEDFKLQFLNVSNIWLTEVSDSARPC